MSFVRLTSYFVLAALTNFTFAEADEKRLTPIVLFGESSSAARKLDAARKLAADRKWNEAIEAYQRLLDSASDEMVPLSTQHCIQLRWLCHRDLAAMGAEALALYRSRVEPQAKKWLEKGMAARDERLLRRVGDEAFCTPSGAVALDLLGDLALERGDGAAAEAWWRLLAPCVGDHGTSAGLPFALTVPADVRIHRPLVQAKQILARILQGRQDGLAESLDVFGQLHGDATGRLAGKEGNFLTILRQIAREPSPSFSENWLTFAGSASRNGAWPRHLQSVRDLRQLCVEGPHARIRFDARGNKGPFALCAPGPATTLNSRNPVLYPVIAGDKVVVADSTTVAAYDWRTGKGEVWYSLTDDQRPVPLGSQAASADLRCTLTVADGHVLARLGTPEIREWSDDERGGARESYLVCLSLQPRRGGRRVCWVVKPTSADRPATFFEGTPIVQSGRVYAAVTRLSGSQSITAIHCYPLHSDDPEPAPLWRQDVCAIRADGISEPRFRHHLLTAAGPLIAYASQAGAVVAVDAMTGRRAWAVRYRCSVSDRQTTKDLTPCVYADGKLFVAPADVDRLLCLDAATGQLLWERDRIEVVHLLGVGKGRVIFTTPEGLRAVGAAAGSDDDGWYQPGGGGRWAPYGRGLLLGDLVLWPTARFGMQVLRQQDGLPPVDLDLVSLRRLRCGNLAYASGCLAVAADRDAISLYTLPTQAPVQATRNIGVNPVSLETPVGTMGDCGREPPGREWLP